jgi:hypothetical protein
MREKINPAELPTGFDDRGGFAVSDLVACF